MMRWARITVLAATAVLAVGTVAVAQERSPNDAGGSAAPSAAQGDDDSGRRLAVFAVLGTLFSTNLNNDVEADAVSAFGVGPGLAVRYQNRDKDAWFKAAYDVVFNRYSRVGDFNRTSHDARAELDYDISPRVKGETRLEASVHGTTEDLNVDTRYIVREDVAVHLTERLNLRLYGAARVKRYPTEDEGKNATNPFVGGELRVKLRGARRWDVGYRFEENDSQDPRFRFRRSTFSTGFRTPLGRLPGRLELDLKFRSRHFSSRPAVEDASGAEFKSGSVDLLARAAPGELRRDRPWWIFEGAWVGPERHRFRAQANYRFDMRSSNDPDGVFHANRVGIGLSYRLW